MNYVPSLRQLAWNTGLLVALASSGCATVPPPAERYVAPPSGSTWVNARVDTGSYGSSSTQLSMTRGERVWQGSDVITFETAEITLLTSPALDYIAQVKDDKVLVSWEPPYNLDWPLQVGKTSKRSYRMTVHAESNGFLRVGAESRGLRERHDARRHLQGLQGIQ